MKTPEKVLLLLVGCPLFAFAAMVIGMMFGSGDGIWLCVVLVMAWAWCALVFRGKWSALPITVGVVVIVAHAMG